MRGRGYLMDTFFSTVRLLLRRPDCQQVLRRFDEEGRGRFPGSVVAIGSDCHVGSAC